MNQPKNVLAVLEWVKENRPDCLSTFQRMFESNDSLGPHEGLIAFTLMGFEAGRIFQKKHPKVESGIGYAPSCVHLKKN